MSFRWLTGAAFLIILNSAASGQWIHWEPGQTFDQGKAVISSAGDPSSDGLFQMFHFHQVNFEISAEWRKGDTLDVSRDSHEVLLYTLAKEAVGGTAIDIRLSHRIGYGSIIPVNGPGVPTMASVLCGNVGSSEHELSFGIELFSDGQELEYTDHPGGVDFESAPAMTFSHSPKIDLLKNSVAARYEVTVEGVKSIPQFGESHLCAVSFGDEGPSWDRVRLTFGDGGSTIPAGTQFRILFSGTPLEKNSSVIPCTSDRLSPLLLLSGKGAVKIPVTGVRYGEGSTGSLRYKMSNKATVAASFDSGRAFVPVELDPDRSGHLLVKLEHDGYMNLQAAMVYGFDRYRMRPLGELLASAWAREAAEWKSERPSDRPLWESSISLCDKTDETDPGVRMVSGSGGEFWARHLNIRRTVFGVMKNDTLRVPARWLQGEPEPERIADEAGSVECANDALPTLAGGYIRTPSGRRPCVWRQREGGMWETIRLEIEPFTSSGSVLAINDRGIACGFLDLALGAEPTRIPCVWSPGESGGYETPPMVLPVPESASAGAALDLNIAGQVVGYFSDSSMQRRACRWEIDPLQFTDLQTEGVAVAISGIGTMAGFGDKGCFLWQSGQRFNLAELTEAESMVSVFGISAFGDLIGRTSGGLVLAEPDSLLKWDVED